MSISTAVSGAQTLVEKGVLAVKAPDVYAALLAR